MRITIVVPGRWHSFELARELEALGALHRIVTNYPKSRTRRWGIPDEKVISLPLTLFLTTLVSKILGETWAMKLQFRINDLFARAAARHLGDPDLVHAWSGTAEPSLLAARKRGIATVLERSSSHMLEQCRLLRNEYSRLGLRWEETPSPVVERELREYELADQVFVPSQFVWRTFAKAGFSERRLFRNGFGVDVAQFCPGPRRDAVFRVIFAGSLSVRKGIHHLVAAFRHAGIPGSELLLVGGTSADTDRLVGPANPDIRRIGHVPQAELPALYQQASVFVMASIEEGQAMVQAQALACGLPLICTANTGGEDFLMLDGDGLEIADGVWQFPAGCVIPPGDPAALAFVLRRMAGDPDGTAAMRNAAAALARRDLSWRRYAAANLARYRVMVQTAGETIEKNQNGPAIALPS
jgi:glycosyltransferase involved in cell wall biosynthesis